jgi:hypothetical protein
MKSDQRRRQKNMAIIICGGRKEIYIRRLMTYRFDCSHEVGVPVVFKAFSLVGQDVASISLRTSSRTTNTVRTYDVLWVN